MILCFMMVIMMIIITCVDKLNGQVRRVYPDWVDVGLTLGKQAKAKAKVGKTSKSRGASGLLIGLTCLPHSFNEISPFTFFHTAICGNVKLD